MVETGEEVDTGYKKSSTDKVARREDWRDVLRAVDRELGTVKEGSHD